MSGRDPYHRFGLRRNPFFAPDDLRIESDRWLDFGYSTPPLPGQRLFVQFIGQKGSGKTSHLLYWQGQTGGEYYYQAPWDWRSRPIVGEIVYWDEANRIPLPHLMIALHQGYRQKATIVVGTHRDLRPFAQRGGFAVKTIHLATLNPDSLYAWIQAHWAAERLSADLPVAIAPSRGEIEAIVVQSQGSWRIAASLLHRWLARQVRQS